MGAGGAGDAGGGDNWINDFVPRRAGESSSSLVPDSGIPCLLGTRGQRLDVVYGPPGTGKTTALLDTVDAELRSGVPPESIAFCSFTNAAVDEAVERAAQRFHFSRNAFSNFNTIHGLSWAVLGRRWTILDEQLLLEFAKRCGYRLSGTVPSSHRDFDELLGAKGTDDDSLLAVYEFSRARRVGIEVGCEQCSIRVPLPALERFVNDYQGYKTEHALADFSDMLEGAVALEAALPVDVAIIDEAQDLSPLQATVVELLFRNCARVYLAGDDDQSIFSHAAADPEYLLSLPQRASKVTVLPKSHRVPLVIHGLAQTIIGENRRRVPKTYEPRDGDPGRVSSLSMQQALDELVRFDGRSFVLVRNAIFMKPWIRELTVRGVTFDINGPAGAAVRATYAAVQTAIDLKDGQAVEVVAVAQMLDFVPTRGASLLPVGAKAAVERLAASTSKATVTRTDLTGMGFERFLDHLDRVGPVDALSKISDGHRRMLGALLRDHGGRLPEPRITLSTIHRAKGQERDLVVVVPDMTEASFDELENRGQAGREAEHRVAYVAVTRAREHLILVDPRKRRFFDYDAYLRAARARLPEERK